MNGIILLVVVCTLYYIVYRYFPERLSEKIHMYFGGGVVIYIVLYYAMVFETNFTHKMFQNIYDSTQQPLYTFNAKGSNANLYYQQNPNADLKERLLTIQGSRCAQCQNYLVGPNDAMMSYRVPLHSGGSNDISNLVVVCSGCHTFR